MKLIWKELSVFSPPEGEVQLEPEHFIKKVYSGNEFKLISSSYFSNAILEEIDLFSVSIVTISFRGR